MSAARSAARSAPGFGRFQKATTLVPLALLSAAVTASLAGLGPAPTAVAGEDRPATLPDGTTVPTDAIEAPASVSTPGVVAPGLGDRDISRAVSGASTSGIPAAALSAYQRAETVINAADPSCNLPWQLVAAVGRVESDHGRANGNTLTDEGLATPGIFGIPLNGKNDTRAISDTDAGQYDSDTRWDRAVGPMQFIPSTWSVVGVDGDNDGKRDPQDIDDAALASAVYLCSGKDDLSTDAGLRASIFRYNHSDEYVELVLAFMEAYLAGDFTSVPNSVTSTFSTSSPTFGPGSGAGLAVFSPDPEPRGGKNGGKQGGSQGGSEDGGSTTGSGGSTDDGGTQTDAPTGTDSGGDDGPLLPEPDLPDIGLPDGDGSGGGSGGGGGGGDDGGDILDGGGDILDDSVDGTTDTLDDTTDGLLN